MSHPFKFPQPSQAELDAAPDRWLSFNEFWWSIVQGKISEIANPALWEDYSEAIDQAIIQMMIPQQPQPHPYDSFGWAASFDAVRSTLKIASDGSGANAVQGDPVGYMSDGSGNDRHVTQTVTSSKPTLATSGGVACLHFDGNDYLQKTGFTLAQPNTIISVFKSSSLASPANVFDSANSAAREALILLSSGYRIAAGAPVDGGTPDLGWHVAVAQFSGASSFLRIDGTQILTGNPGAQGMNGINIGIHFQLIQAFSGYQRAFYIANRTLLTSEIQKVENYYLNEVL